MDPQVRNTVGEVVKVATGVLGPVTVIEGTGSRVSVANTEYKCYKISFCKYLGDTFSYVFIN